MIVGFVIGGEIGFWVVLLGGLIARYVLRWQRTSVVLLVATPLVDLVLLVASTIDLHNGSEPSWAHGLAAAYLGFSVGFGHTMIRWADERFAHRFAGGPPPVKPPERGTWARARHEWGQWLRMLVAAAVACVLLLAAIVYVGADGETEQLWNWMGLMGIITGIWLVADPLWETARAIGAREEKVEHSHRE